MIIDRIKKLPGYYFLRSVYLTCYRLYKVAMIPLYWIWCSSQGVKMRSGWHLSGRPQFRIRGNGSKITIGKSFLLKVIINKLFYATSAL